MAPPRKRAGTLRCRDPDVEIAAAIQASLYEQPYRTVSLPLPERKPRSDMAGIVRADQDAEYLETIAELDRRDQIEQARLAKEQQKQQQENKAKLIERETILTLVETLEPEPEEGCEVKVVLPQGRIVSRKFAVNVNGNDVYLWVASQEEMFDGQKFPIPFRLAFGVQTVLERLETLEGQKISRRVQFRVLPL
jgi:hypothetical protein